MKKETYSNQLVSIEEYSGLWKRDLNESCVSDDEYSLICEALDKALADYFSENAESHAYVRGDNYGDRSQYVEIVDWYCLTSSFVLFLQKWLKSNHFSNWRILIPTYLSDVATIAIYDDAIKLPSGYGDTLESALSHLRSSIIEKDKHQGNRNCIYGVIPINKAFDTVWKSSSIDSDMSHGEQVAVSESFELFILDKFKNINCEFLSEDSEDRTLHLLLSKSRYVSTSLIEAVAGFLKINASWRAIISYGESDSQLALLYPDQVFLGDDFKRILESNDA